MADFKPFAQAVHAQFTAMSKHELFVVDVSGDTLYEKYLAAFPEGTNPIFRERTEHDCSCCKNFIRNIGNVVAVINGKLITVWDTEEFLEYPYDVVAAQLVTAVANAAITGLFRATERSYGAEYTVETLGDGKTRRWNHFHAPVAPKHYAGPKAAEQKGEYATLAQVFKRGLDELSADAFNTVIGLIEAKALYRGEEHLPAIRAFRELQNRYNNLGTAEANQFVWLNASHHAARFRNTVIGTLIQDLSAGMDLEAAVRSFETKVAPTNYKRTTALITPGMIAQAMKTIDELGLEPSLQRRHAKLSDITINNVLWADASAQTQMKGGLTGLLMESVAAAPLDPKKAEAISIDDFLAKVLPTAKSMEAMVRNSQQGNFMSVTAPVHADTKRLFKWDNDFAWSYDGNITDSIKERVKKAGGNVTAPLRVSLSWDNKDDLDLHILSQGSHIYFGNRGHRNPCGGTLDVDANGMDGLRSDPVENVYWQRPLNGKYEIQVNNYTQREVDKVGFTIEIECNGQVQQFSCPKSPRTRETFIAATMTVKDGQIIDLKIGNMMSGGTISQDKWGIKTEQFSKVNTVMLSPNYWDDNTVGNKHWFFILEGCKNPEPVRGIYNEFLHSSLDKHRKVFEVLGDKTKCPVVDNQLSGVGFSSTRGDSVIVAVATDKGRRIYNVQF